MKILLDTHAFVFAISEPEQLSAKGRRLLADADNERWVSAVSLWEIAVKVSIGKLAMPTNRSYYTNHARQVQARWLPAELGHSFRMFKLPLHHKDPFDRLLAAQALDEGLTFMTRDGIFGAYNVPCVW